MAAAAEYRSISDADATPSKLAKQRAISTSLMQRKPVEIVLLPAVSASEWIELVLSLPGMVFEAEVSVVLAEVLQYYSAFLEDDSTLLSV